MRYVYLVLALVCVLTVSVMGFRGSKSTKPPLEVFPDMDRQAKYKPQSASPLFADGRADRPLPAGVVSRVPVVDKNNPLDVNADDDGLRSDDHLYRGKDAKGQWATNFPAALTVDGKLLERGKDRYSIYCYPCHGALGDGKGIVTEYGWGAPANFHSDTLRKMPDGEIFNTITNGKNTMFPYADKLTPQDRWAVIAYVRALQRAQLGSVADVPPANKSELGIK